MKKERLCKFCGIECNPTRWVKGLCHTHHQLYLNAKGRLPRHIERAKAMQELIWLVEGRPNIELDTSATNYVTPKESIDTARI